MPHYLVTQVHFARSEFVRCLDGVDDVDARRRLQPMNCLSWMIGHLADQEHRYWVMLAQEQNLLPELHERVGFGKPASTPPLDAMWQAWRTATEAADRYLNSLTEADMGRVFHYRGRAWSENIGTMLQRQLYHYWFHTGEAHAVRQMLGHPDLPQFVGRLGHAAYAPSAENG